MRSNLDSSAVLELFEIVNTHKGQPTLSRMYERIHYGKLAFVLNRKYASISSKGIFRRVSICHALTVNEFDTPAKIVDNFSKLLEWMELFTVVEIERAFGDRDPAEWGLVVKRGEWLSVSLENTGSRVLMFMNSSFSFKRLKNSTVELKKRKNELANRAKLKMAMSKSPLLRDLQEGKGG